MSSTTANLISPPVLISPSDSFKSLPDNNLVDCEYAYDLQQSLGGNDNVITRVILSGGDTSFIKRFYQRVSFHPFIRFLNYCLYFVIFLFSLFLGVWGIIISFHFWTFKNEEGKTGKLDGCPFFSIYILIFILSISFIFISCYSIFNFIYQLFFVDLQKQEDSKKDCCYISVSLFNFCLFIIVISFHLSVTIYLSVYLLHLDGKCKLTHHNRRWYLNSYIYLLALISSLIGTVGLPLLIFFIMLIIVMCFCYTQFKSLKKYKEIK